ncbi:MAG: lipopolysaccharide transport periplasmic protein LptA [Alysiella sp.]|uniref:lipopolysaccharide transport periplasmic protein LptA n=1 Tax=Alysiella sp. TaxID=1872483 RepID=UPI0026DC316C|nr:lipopolysaccharide transport periplasmic protein LptA [Alysiella sp.]MDO4434163.1 lipopolysaccharide transport periplasmic protein LptA [Alysiella sp.]
MTLNNFLKFTLFTLYLSGSLHVWALESDRKQPIEIEADQGSLDQKNQVTVFSGNVLIKQGSLNIQAQTVRVTQDNSGNQTMTATGSPVRFSQALENKGTVMGEGNKVEYASSTNVVKLLGNAKVQRGGDLAQGEVITYNTRTEVYTVLGGNAAGNKNGRRVTVIIQPTNP